MEEDNKEKKDNDAIKSKDNIFNTPAALEKYMNLATIVKEGEDGSHF